MKKPTIAIGLIFGAVLFCSAQVDTITDNMYQKNGKIGIGTTDPFTWLSVENTHPTINQTTNVSLADFMRTYGGSSARLTIYGYPNTSQVSDYYRGSVMLYASGDAKQLKIASTNPGGSIQFITGDWINNSYERMTILDNGNIGISNPSPVHKLDVDGDINITGRFLQNGEEISLDYTSPWKFDDTLFIYTNSYVGIGNTLPAYSLDVNGDINLTGKIFQDGEELSFDFSSPWTFDDPLYLHTNRFVGIGTAQPAYSLEVVGDLNFTGNLYQDGVRLQGVSQWTEISEDTLYYEGNVGVGTDAPSSRLEVANGDIYISDIHFGIVLKSPDGQCWRGVLDNSGGLHFSPVRCPEVPVSTKSMKINQSIQFFPNPTTNQLIVSISDLRIGTAKYSIHSLNGTIVDSGNITSDLQSIDVSHLAQGAYLLNVHNNSGELLAVERIVKE